MPQRDSVFNQLRAAIANGELLPGEKITETTYAEIFHVSRTPVREALHMLEQAGLVVYHPQKGCFVRDLPTLEEVEEVYSIRSALEVLSAEALLKNATTDTINRLDLFNKRCQKAIEREDLNRYCANIDAFNELQISMSQMPLLIKLINTIETYQPGSSFEDGNVSKLKALTYTPERQKETLEEHIRILDAIRKGNLERLRNELRIHLENSKLVNVKAYKEYQRIIDTGG